MNTTELPVRPDVSAFVDRVRALLADLLDEDRLELTEAGTREDRGDRDSRRDRPGAGERR